MTTNNTSAADRGYNGWSNYETWAVSLWIDNVERWTQQRISLVNNAKDRPTTQQISWLAGALKRWIDGENPLAGSLYADLLDLALQRVNWLEMAQRFLT
jgi:hypothetical protein